MAKPKHRAQRKTDAPTLARCPAHDGPWWACFTLVTGSPCPRHTPGKHSTDGSLATALSWPGWRS
jgi:hypothetical protein